MLNNTCYLRTARIILKLDSVMKLIKSISVLLTALNKDCGPEYELKLVTEDKCSIPEILPYIQCDKMVLIATQHPVG